MILGHDDILNYVKEHKLDITHINEDTIQQNGIDCRIGDTVAFDIDLSCEDDFGQIIEYVVDTHNQESINKKFIINHITDYVEIPKQTYVIFVTEEIFDMPDNVVGLIAFRSSFARLGFQGPLTVDDAGFQGTLSIGMFHAGKNPIKIYKGDRFVHIVFAEVKTPVKKLYNGVYKGQTFVRLPKCLD